MKKLMSIFGVILFASAFTLTSCGDAAEVNDTPTVEEVAAVCSNTGEACLEDHSCCAADADSPATDEEVKACCCGDNTCDGSCHGDEAAAAEAHGDDHEGHDH
ncbi:MAG: hypothetical protein QNK60_06040 [Flavobacteriales bacterium]|tara:strand:+ start:565 stop:873 length:309 start_codon:yes stop_codon:yes gene_type:complete